MNSNRFHFHLHSVDGTHHQCEMCFGGLNDTQVRSRRFGLGRQMQVRGQAIRARRRDA